MNSIEIDGSKLTLAQVGDVALHNFHVDVHEDVWKRLHAAREVVDALVAGDTLIYGLNSGLGALKDIRITPEQIAQYQRNILLSHATGVGEPYSSATVRAIMIAHLNQTAQGGSGAHPDTFKLLLDMLNAGVHPVIPRIGSVGMADLPQKAQLGLALIGEGRAEYKGQIMPAADALKAATLEPVKLAAKDGLSMVSTNAASSGPAALAVTEVAAVLAMFDLAAMMAYEGYQAQVDPLDLTFDQRRTDARRQIVNNMRRLLDGSYLFTTEHKTIQPPISFRAVVQIHAAVLEAIDFARSAIENELNGPADNPIVSVEQRRFITTADFHPASYVVPLEALAIALTQAASAAANRVLRLNTAHFSGLPSQLVAQPGLNMGYAVVQKTITALYAEVRHLANPASLDYFPVADGIEDHATNATYVVEKLRTIVDRLTYVAALELLTAVQAVDLREDVQLGAGTQAAYDQIRSVAPFAPDDVFMAPQIEAVYQLLKSGKLT